MADKDCSQNTARQAKPTTTRNLLDMALLVFVTAQVNRQ
jgi:hypothetical protein